MKKLPSRLNIKQIQKQFVARNVILVSIVFLGVIMLVISKAATSTASFEAESGNKCNSSLERASIAGASNSKYIRFATNVCSATIGGEDMRGHVGELPIYPTNPSTLIDQWLQYGAPPDNPRDEGAFRFQCKPSHLLYDDPIVYPGRPGAAHLHLFYGNDTANANSTYESLRKNGTGTCEGGVINRSSYWLPALLNGSGKVIMPDWVQVYYKVQQPDRAILNYIPRGLRMIAGHPLNSGATDAQVYGPSNPTVPGGYIKAPLWKCLDPVTSTYRTVSQTYGIITDVIPSSNVCRDGDELYAVVAFPYCWNKDRIIDSNDHRTHVVFPPDYDDVCPASHPIRIPEFTIITRWGIRSGEASQMSNWYLSSDRKMDGSVAYPNGKSLHADWFGAWDDDVMHKWIDGCLKGFMSCNNANLNSPPSYPGGPQTLKGKQPTVPVNGSLVPWYFEIPNAGRLVNVPPMPM